MRLAIFLEDKDFQIVLTPEDEREKEMLKLLHSDPRVRHGTFYQTRGGYITFSCESTESVMIPLTNDQARLEQRYREVLERIASGDLSLIDCWRMSREAIGQIIE